MRFFPKFAALGAVVFLALPAISTAAEMRGVTATENRRADAAAGGERRGRNDLFLDRDRA